MHGKLCAVDEDDVDDDVTNCSQSKLFFLNKPMILLQHEMPRENIRQAVHRFLFFTFPSLRPHQAVFITSRVCAGWCAWQTEKTFNCHICTNSCMTMIMMIIMLNEAPDSADARMSYCNTFDPWSTSIIYILVCPCVQCWCVYSIYIYKIFRLFPFGCNEG